MVAGKQTEQGRSTLLLPWQSMPRCSNGIMTETARTEIFLTTHHYEAASSFGGSAKNAQRARFTAGRLRLSLELYSKGQQDALVALGTSFVSATVCKLSILISLVTLTLKRMVSLLLK